MEQAPLISVVLATYNGSAYLSAQLDSIYKQSYKNIEVIVCDDRSTDTTIDILQLYATQYGLLFYINKARQGVIRNFEKAISYAKGEYIALSDQDDIWIPEKLEQSLEKMLVLEAALPQGAPALIYTDLTVVNEDLEIINPSYWQYMQLNPAGHQLSRVLVENVATGCTMLLNRATISLALPIPAAVLMHDVWFLLVASCFGKADYLKKATVLYRQHQANVVGAKQKSLIHKVESGIRKLKENKFLLLEEEIEQAKAFQERFINDLLNFPDHKEVLEAFVSLKAVNMFKRKYLILKHAFYGSTFKKALNILLRA